MSDYATHADGQYNAARARGLALMEQWSAEDATGHRAHLENHVTWRDRRPHDVKFRDACSCGEWVGEWVGSAGLAHSAHDRHREEATS